MDILAIQKILHDAIKEYTITANVPQEVLVSLVSVDIYRKLRAVPAPKASPRRNPAPSVPAQTSTNEVKPGVQYPIPLVTS